MPDVYETTETRGGRRTRTMVTTETVVHEAPVPNEPGWTAVATFRRRNGEFIMTELAVRADDPEASKGVTARLLRQVSTTDLESAAAAASAEVDEIRKPDRRLPPAPWFRGLARDDLYFAEWAERWVKAVGAGSRSPNVDLARDHDMRPEQIRDLIHAARSRKLLTSGGGRGKVSGQLTEKAVRLLAGGEEHGER